MANLHMSSVSPNGRFGNHVATCRGEIKQPNEWTDSWCDLFTNHFSHIVQTASPTLDWQEFDVVARLVLENVVPRLLQPLESEGRRIKPCLVHGDCWDDNTAVDANTGEAFLFGPCSFYGHNEYDLGAWRAPRHRFSSEAYIKSYHRYVSPSEPIEDWGARNVLYSLAHNLTDAISIRGSEQKYV